MINKSQSGIKISATEKTRYWNTIAEECENKHPQVLWRVHSDAVNNNLFARWLPDDNVRRLLKTDLFDEAFSDGLYPLLVSRAHSIVGIDLSTLILSSARSRHGILYETKADVRYLPFSDNVYDVIVSNSTLDHFESPEEIVIGLEEFYRILRARGYLLITLDNLANPVIALRNSLPTRLLNRLGIVPYYVGATFGPRRFRRILNQVGFEVLEINAVLHCPRVFAVAVANLLEKHASPRIQTHFLHFLMSFEYLSGWPTRFLTGYYIVIRAMKK